jgi:hypothetical protein
MAAGSRVLIPATGTVRFIVWNFEGHDDIPTTLHIEGDREWRRPVVGLVFVPPIESRHNTESGTAEYFQGSDALHAPKGKGLDAYPVVVDECGITFEVYDYLESRMGESHWDCATHFYEPHIDGPVTDSPRIRQLDLVFCRCGCAKEVKRGTDCTGEPVTATA